MNAKRIPTTNPDRKLFARHLTNLLASLKAVDECWGQLSSPLKEDLSEGYPAKLPDFSELPDDVATWLRYVESEPKPITITLTHNEAVELDDCLAEYAMQQRGRSNMDLSALLEGIRPRLVDSMPPATPTAGLLTAKAKVVSATGNLNGLWVALLDGPCTGSEWVLANAPKFLSPDAIVEVTYTPDGEFVAWQRTL